MKEKQNWTVSLQIKDIFKGHTNGKDTVNEIILF